MENISKTDIIKSFRRLAKGLTPDQKRIRWQVYAQKAERQEIMFKRVFENIFDEQKKIILEQYGKIGTIPTSLIDEDTARKFEPAIELVYKQAFEDAI